MDKEQYFVSRCPWKLRIELKKRKEYESPSMDERIKGKRIMVVDDESDLTLFFSMSLEYHGFEVEAFNDAKKALANFKPDYYDLVVLDIKMPDMDGFELYKEIRNIDSRANVCFLTASELYYEEFREKEYNAIDKDLFIRKPIGNEELIKEINRLIENKEVT
jgi:DNA-binding response OmpR family regulator